jgi:hypothetical protein
MPSDPPPVQAGAQEPLPPAPLTSEAGALAAGLPTDARAVSATDVGSSAVVAAADSGFPSPGNGDSASDDAARAEAVNPGPPRKGPLSFLSGALTSGLLAWLCLGVSGRVVGYYADHPPLYQAQFAQSIATAMKTLIVGMCFLATFSFAFIGIGLLLTFLRSLRPAVSGKPS